MRGDAGPRAGRHSRPQWPSRAGRSGRHAIGIATERGAAACPGTNRARTRGCHAEGGWPADLAASRPGWSRWSGRLHATCRWAAGPGSPPVGGGPTRRCQAMRRGSRRSRSSDVEGRPWHAHTEAVLGGARGSRESGRGASRRRATSVGLGHGTSCCGRFFYFGPLHRIRRSDLF